MENEGGIAKKHEFYFALLLIVDWSCPCLDMFYIVWRSANGTDHTKDVIVAPWFDNN